MQLWGLLHVENGIRNRAMHFQIPRRKVFLMEENVFLEFWVRFLGYLGPLQMNYSTSSSSVSPTYMYFNLYIHMVVYQYTLIV